MINPSLYWGREKRDETAPAGGRREVTQQVTVDHPRLWSLESPNLYQLRTTIVRNGQPVDRTTTNFGIRTLRFDANKGTPMKEWLALDPASHVEWAQLADEAYRFVGRWNE